MCRGAGQSRRRRTTVSSDTQPRRNYFHRGRGVPWPSSFQGCERPLVLQVLRIQHRHTIDAQASALRACPERTPQRHRCRFYSGALAALARSVQISRASPPRLSTCAVQSLQRLSRARQHVLSSNFEHEGCRLERYTGSVERFVATRTVCAEGSLVLVSYSP